MQLLSSVEYSLLSHQAPKDSSKSVVTKMALLKLSWSQNQTKRYEQEKGTHKKEGTNKDGKEIRGWG